MFVCLDIETTGLNPKEDHIIEVAIVRFDYDKIIEEWSTLIKPPINIPEFTKRLTGINDESVKDAPRIKDVLNEIKNKISDKPIMGHFIFFDVNFLSQHGLVLENAQLDSCQLAQVVLPNEASYSLEVLAEKLKIDQPEAHRALDDVKANIALFWRLAEHIKSLDEKSKSELKEILEKSDWPWAKFLLPLLSQKADKLIPISKARTVISSEQHVDLFDLTKELSTPFLFEESSHTYLDLINYSAHFDQALLVIPEIDLLPEHEDLGVIKHPNQYIDEDRLDIFLSKENLNTTETMLGAKVKLWLHHTSLGEESELRIVKEEKNAWLDICCLESDTPNSYYKKAQENAFNKKVIAISHEHFLKERIRKNPSLQIPSNLVIGQVEQFIKTIEPAWHISLSESKFLNDILRLKNENPNSSEVLDHIASKISILFGFLGMVMQKYGEENDPRHTLVIEQHHINTQEWNKVIKSSDSIYSSIEALGTNIKDSPAKDEFERYLNFLRKILKTKDPILWMTFTNDLQPIVHVFPENPNEIFSERIWKDIENLHLFCHHGNLSDDFKFLKRELSLPEEMVTKDNEDIIPTPIILPENKISSPNDPRNIKEVAHELSKHLIDGNILLLVSSKAAAEQFFYILPKNTDRPLFVQNLSGGMGKIFKLAQKTDGQNIFVGNDQLLEFLINEGVNISQLAIHRLPFANPSDPIQKARSAIYEDKYKDFSLPQAKLKLQGIFNKFLGNKWENKKILMLDPRFQSLF